MLNKFNLKIICSEIKELAEKFVNYITFIHVLLITECISTTNDKNYLLHTLQAKKSLKYFFTHVFAKKKAISRQQRHIQ